MDQATNAHNRSADTGKKAPGRFVAVSLGIVLAWIVMHLGWMTAHVFGATRFILGDEGSYLYAIGRWQAGEALYRDFAWQYGPLALGWYRAFAAMGGNTPLTLVLASSAAFALAWVLIAKITANAIGWLWGGFLAVAGLLPVMSASGPFTLNGAHGAIEMLLLSLIASVLSARKTATGNPWLLGVLVGLMHWVRFGPHLVALIGIMILTAWQLGLPGKIDRAFLRTVSGFAGRLLLAYALIAAPLVLWFFAALPPTGAREQLWPTYMVAHYAATYPQRWPEIPSLTVFCLMWLPALLGVGWALFRLGQPIWRTGAAADSATQGRPTGLIFLPLQYVLSCAVLFHNDHAMRGHLWLAWPGLALAALPAAKWARMLTLAVLVPAVVSTALDYRSLLQEERTEPTQPIALPNGQQLWFNRSEATRFGALQAALGPQPQTRKVAVFLAGGGVHHFFGVQRVGRQWWFLPEFVRPWEADKVLGDLLHHDMILVADRGQLANSPSAGPGAVSLWLPLPGEMTRQLVPHLRNPQPLPGIGVLVQIVP